MDRSLDRALGAVWLWGFQGAEPSDAFLRVLNRYRPACIILFRDNLPEAYGSLPRLRKRLEEAAERPLSFWLDEEGGWIQQLCETSWPSPAAQARSGSAAVAACHRAMAARLRDAGAQVVISPLADLDDGAVNPVIGTRAFGADPQQAGAMLAAAVRGLRAGGVLPVLKHFPGHGDSEEDSHLTLPVVPADRSRALIPFEQGLAAGARALMTAHLQLAGAEDPRPATFRPDIMSDLLGRELGFDGLLVTDALEMAGAAVIPARERAAQALAAGCHLLCLARWEAGGEALLAGLAAALGAGRIKAAAVESAAERLESFLGSLPSEWDAGRPAPDLEAVDAAALFVPGRTGGLAPGDLAALWDGQELDLELGPCGSWREDEFLAALKGLPIRRLGSADPLRAESFLYIGRTAPGRERQDEIARLSAKGRAPALLICGPWRWSLPFSPRLATAASSPAGVRIFLDEITRAHGR